MLAVTVGDRPVGRAPRPAASPSRAAGMRDTGVEVMFAPKWSVKAEYLYRSLDGETYFTGIVPGGLPVGTINLNSVQVGVNYHF